MKVVIRRSPPLMILHGSRSGMLRRAVTLALALGAIAAAYRCAVLLVADIGGSASRAPSSVVNRWSLWLGIALACAACASVSWGAAQRPRKRE